MNPKELFNAYLDGELSPEQFQQLEAWINADPRNATEFLKWVGLQAWTREALKGDLLEQVLRDRTPAPRFGAFGGRATSVRNWALGLAASLLVAAIAYWVGSRPGANPPIAQADVKARPNQSTASISVSEVDRTAEPLAVATLTRLEECEWSDESSALRYGQQLVEGTRVALRSGVLRIAFESGAEAVLQGPCDFTVDNAMHGTIRSGRVAVTAPKRAYGFRIRSPNAEVIDLGTEFGVNVDEGGNSEVHVFSGEVLSRSINDLSDQAGELIRVTANNALKFAGEQLPSKIASDNTLFAVAATLAQRPPASDSVPADAGLALWLAADSSVKTQEGRRVVAWSDILHGDNLSAEDALQPETANQPMFAPKGINGRPAVRFNGSSSYLVTTPLETTDNQTIFVVCQFNKAAMRPGRKRGGQILNYNGPPHRLVSSTYEPGVLQIGEPIVEGFAPTRLGGKLFSGRLGGKDVSESEMYASPLGVGVPVVLAYRYDLANHRSSLWINGELLEEKPALRPAGVTSRKTIGRHGFMKFFFAGEVGELMIFNSALGDADLDDVTNYLLNKFHIPRKPSAPAS
jgi:hypothetical protein